jgi:hypothetical protein
MLDGEKNNNLNFRFGSGLTNFFKTSLDVISGIGDFFFSFILFLTFLFYFINVILLI